MRQGCLHGQPCPVPVSGRNDGEVVLLHPVLLWYIVPDELVGIIWITDSVGNDNKPDISDTDVLQAGTAAAKEDPARYSAEQKRRRNPV